jgi:hypothetical protein
MINSASYLGTDYIGTGIDFRAAYELSARFTLLLQAGYANDDYRDVASGSTVSRDDNYFYIRPGFRYTASPYCYLELYYFYRNNDSSINTASFNDMQIGMTVNVTF